jgi:hypothetical protein
MKDRLWIVTGGQTATIVMSSEQTGLVFLKELLEDAGLAQGQTLIQIASEP